MLKETDLDLDDGRTLHVYETTSHTDDSDLVVFWHHGTPNVGEPPEPLSGVAAELGIRWVSVDRPGYGGSTPLSGRNVASSAADVASVADALGIEQFAVMGHSGGGTYGLASGALLGDRVVGMVCAAGLAPFHAEGLDWFAGMAPSGEAELRAATRGRAALGDFVLSMKFAPDVFTPADEATFRGDWSWLAGIVQRGIDTGLDGMLDDDLSYVAPWGFEPEQIACRVLYVYGEQDRMVPSPHGGWLAEHTASSELWLRPEDGHISVLQSAAAALEWLRNQAS